MEERVKILVCLGAATASNCQPCFSHYFKKAQGIDLSPEEIQEVVALAAQVKQGAHMAVKNHIQTLLGQERKNDLPCSSESRNTCCG